MIGVDTNVLLRIYVRDDRRQSEAATRFLAERSRTSPMFISVVVLVEFAWTLRKTFGYRQNAIDELLIRMAESQDIILERAEHVKQALFAAQRSQVDFPDLLIALTNEAAGCERTVTFDKAMARSVPGVELLV